MAMKRYPIHSKTKGSLGENEDTWVLLVDTDTGERTVEHWWHHMNPYKGTTTSEGEKILTLAEFEATEHGSKLVLAMNAADENA